jgi:hypothetical protein
VGVFTVTRKLSVSLCVFVRRFKREEVIQKGIIKSLQVLELIHYQEICKLDRRERNCNYNYQ